MMVQGHALMAAPAVGISMAAEGVADGSGFPLLLALMFSAGVIGWRK